MRKKLRTASAIVLASAMAVGMSVPAFAEETTEAAAGSTTDWEPFAETVELQIPVYDRGVEGVPNVSDNYWTQWIQENFGDKYNINVTYVPIVRTDVLTSYSLLASSGDLPTILMEYDYPKVAQWANDGYLRSFNMEDFAAIAPTYYQRMVDNNQIQYTILNDETYFCCALRPYYNTTYTFQNFVRMDWLEQVGYDHVPMTRDEYVDAMTKIMEAGIAEHPGGGQMVTGGGSDQSYDYREWPLNEEEWAMYGDYNIPSLGWYPNKQYLYYANQDYNLGITDPEYYLIDAEQAKTNFINGESYSYGSYISADMDWLTAFYEANPDAKLAIKPVVSTTDPTTGQTPGYRTDNPFGMMVGFSSTATDDEVKAAWMYMEWLTQPENLFTFQWGIEGENFNYDENGLPISVTDYSGDYTMGYNNNKDYWCITIEARNAGTIEDIIYNNLPHDLPQDFTEDIVNWYYDKVQVAEAGWGIPNCMFSVVIDSETEYQQTLLEKYKELRDELTMCSPEEFDALYEEAAQEYADAGYAAVTEERKEAYEAGNSTKLPNTEAEEVQLEDATAAADETAAE
ncbi:MAG: hypothetical protein ACOX8B_06540 [Lachnospiraceae bacterium]|jgi:putative aldouronate transport system substrate-binding protein